MAKGYVANGDGDRVAGIRHGSTTGETVGGLHGDGADHIVTNVLGDLEGQRALATLTTEVNVYVKCVV